MAFLDEEALIEFPCPNCGKKIKKSIRWFKEDGHSCPRGCGLVFKTGQFRREFEKAEKATADLARNLGRTINLKPKM